MKTFVALLTLATVCAANPSWGGPWNSWGAQPKWHGPIALPPGYDANGAPLPVQDTPEVAAEKAAQLAVLASRGGNVPAPAWNAAAAWGNPWAGAAGPWAVAPGAWGVAPGAWGVAHGVPRDTPEVAAAKAAHAAAHAAAAHRGRRSAVLGAAPVLLAPGLVAPVVAARGFGYSATAVAPLVSGHGLLRHW